MIKIIKVENKKDLMRFIKFPWKIYKNDPNWVPPLMMDRKHILDKQKNPFYKHAEADWFLAEKDGELVGRIGAIKNDLHNQIHNDKMGFFGFFECIDDAETAKALLTTAELWCKEKGLTEIMGPANPSSNDDWGSLIEGFDDPPRLMMTYNPPYYNSLYEKCGYGKLKDLYAWKLEHDKVLESGKIERVAKLAAQRAGLTIRALNMKDFKGELAKVKEVYNQAWAPNWGFVPLTDEEIDDVAANLKQIVEPSIVLFGEINGKTIGFALVMLDYNQVFINMNGASNPLQFIKLFTQKKKITWSRIITLGVIPEYQKRGLDSVFYYEIVTRAHKIGIDLGEASWVLENNDMMNRGAETMHGTLYKKYRLFSKSL